MTFDGAALMRQVVATSPFAVHLGISVVELGDGRAVLAMPFRQELVTLGRTVHGGPSRRCSTPPRWRPRGAALRSRST